MARTKLKDLVQAFDTQRPAKWRDVGLALREIWKAVPEAERDRIKKEGNGHWRFPFLPSLPKTAPYVIERLQNAEERDGYDVSALWAAWDGGMSPGTVQRVLQSAKKAAKPGEAFQRAVEERINDPKLVQTKSEASEKEPPVTEYPYIYHQLQRLHRSAVSAAKVSVPEGADAQGYRETYDELVAGIWTILAIARRSFAANARRSKKRIVPIPVPGALEVACEVPKVPPPETPNAPVDLVAARRTWHVIARECHPDLGHKDADKAALYIEAAGAYQTVQNHNATLNLARSNER